MPAINDPSSPAADRAAASPLITVGTCTALLATDLFTLTSGSLDRLQSGDIVKIAGTLTGGAGIVVGQEYLLSRVSSTTFRLLNPQTLAVVDVTSDLTAGGSLQYGNGRVSGVLSSNIVSQGSVAGGAYATVLD